MQRIAAGSEASITELYDRFGSLVFKTARQILPTRTEADDAMQEIFIRLWQTADRFDPQRAKLVTWVMLIARRHLIDRLRRNIANPRPATLDESRSDAGPGSGEAQPERRSLDQERNARIRARIAALPALQRVVIERAYLQGFTLREVSEQLDAPLGTVKSALSRGLAKLREELRGEHVRGDVPPSVGPRPPSTDDDG